MRHTHVKIEANLLTSRIAASIACRKRLDTKKNDDMDLNNVQPGKTEAEKVKENAGPQEYDEGYDWLNVIMNAINPQT